MKKQSKKCYVGKKKYKTGVELTPGIKGFLISSNVEQKAEREALNILNEYSDGIIEESYESKKSTSDPIDAIERQSDDIRELSNRFKVVDTKCKNLIFIKSSAIDPMKLVDTIFEDILSKNIVKARFCQRFYPIITSSHCNITSIEKKFIEFFIPMLKERYPMPQKYSIIVKIRNSGPNKKEIKNKIEDIVCEKIPHFICSDSSCDFSVSFFIIRNVCLMSLLSNYQKFKKYNINNLNEM